MNVGVAGIANNHALDFGEEALQDTIELLHAAGIATAGAGLGRDAARRPAVVSVAGMRVGRGGCNRPSLRVRRDHGPLGRRVRVDARRASRLAARADRHDTRGLRSRDHVSALGAEHGRPPSRLAAAGCCQSPRGRRGPCRGALCARVSRRRLGSAGRHCLTSVMCSTTTWSTRSCVTISACSRSGGPTPTRSWSSSVCAWSTATRAWPTDLMPTGSPPASSTPAVSSGRRWRGRPSSASRSSRCAIDPIARVRAPWAEKMADRAGPRLRCRRRRR